MSLEFRDYQAEIFDRVRAAIAGGARTLVMQMPTGAGKTRIFAELLKRCVSHPGQRALFLAHLDSLLDDTMDRLRADDVPVGLIQGGRPANPEAPVQVASIQTLHARGEAARPPAKLVILDECHRSEAPTVRAILDAYRHSAIIGGTATPQRGDGQALKSFDMMIEGPSVKALTARGYLVPCELLAPEGPTDGKLALDPVIAYERHTPGTRAIVFAPTVAYAHDLTKRFTAAGYPAEVVIGETPTELRRAIRERLRTGETKVLIGVGVFIEGFDCAEVETVILARAFTVTGAFLQAIGRGLRLSIHTGKTRCTVIDLMGNVFMHGLPDEDRVWSIKGRACRRTETITALQRCRECLAVFRPSKSCPRCGAATKGAARMPRVLSASERLVRFDALPPEVRDLKYLEKLAWVASSRMHMSDSEAVAWAHRQFKKRFGREPVGSAA